MILRSYHSNYYLTKLNKQATFKSVRRILHQNKDGNLSKYKRFLDYRLRSQIERANLLHWWFNRINGNFYDYDQDRKYTQRLLWENNVPLCIRIKLLRLFSKAIILFLTNSIYTMIWNDAFIKLKWT